uniref:IclR family transcriptional regulator domain-containing protein n=1 Tax=Arthrobacter sp. TaxID=1667 RepID=UPI000EB77305|nr:IclR family transcriptional regulator C-terminal domain-containing protein [Arthrobacter sp.]AXV46643.1 transcriptional regulator, IclR family [Arthrobacter sp.]
MTILFPDTSAPTKDPDHVESLERGLLVLRILTAQDRPLSITELADSVGITRTAARRFALTLEHLGYVGQDAAGYSLRSGVLEIGDAYLRSNRLPAIAHPYLASLVRDVGESASLTSLHGRRVVYLDRVVAERVITANIVVGTSVPAHATATGRVLLAGLGEESLREYLQWLEADAGQGDGRIDVEETARLIARSADRGWALADQELTRGIMSIAVPVHDPAGEVVAALNISAHASRTSSQVLEDEVLPLLQKAAMAMEADLRTAEPDPTPTGGQLAAGLPRPVGALRAERPRPKDAVQSLERGLAVLTAFDEDHKVMNLSEVSDRCDLPRSVARRFLRTLMNLGYLYAEGRRFGPTPGVLALGYSYLAKLSLADIVRPHLESLSRLLDASVSVGVLDGLDVRYVGRVNAPGALAVSIKVGSRVPAPQTAMGRVLLASLSDERLNQYMAATEEALDANRLDSAARAELVEALQQIQVEHCSYVDQLLEVGIRAVSIPLRNRHQDVVAALSASVHDTSTSEEEMRRKFLPLMRESAEAMTLEFRHGIEA